ncbi:hypothetical protein BVX99_01385 [bacterium F16]|nr:hypothetical protein BVX99_01385 [bacterium F16]
MLSDVYDDSKRGGVLGHLARLQGVGRWVGVALGGLMYDRFGTRPGGWGGETGTLFLLPLESSFFHNSHVLGF